MDLWYHTTDPLILGHRRNISNALRCVYSTNPICKLTDFSAVCHLSRKCRLPQSARRVLPTKSFDGNYAENELSVGFKSWLNQAFPLLLQYLKVIAME